MVLILNYKIGTLCQSKLTQQNHILHEKRARSTLHFNQLSLGFTYVDHSYGVCESAQVHHIHLIILTI